MLDFLKRFWTEEDGFTTVEIVVIVAVLVGVALIFRDGITDFVNRLMNTFFTKPDPSVNRDPNAEFPT